MAKVKGYGCTSVVHALCLQFSLAGLGLRCALHRTSKGQWVVEAQLRDYTRDVPAICTVTPPVAYCDCAQGRFPCTCKGRAIARSIDIHGGI